MKRIIFKVQGGECLWLKFPEAASQQIAEYFKEQGNRSHSNLFK